MVGFGDGMMAFSYETGTGCVALPQYGFTSPLWIKDTEISSYFIGPEKQLIKQINAGLQTLNIVSFCFVSFFLVKIRFVCSWKVTSNVISISGRLKSQSTVRRYLSNHVAS